MTPQGMKTACLGAGRMGRGIAQSLAMGGAQVALLDAKARSAEDFARFHDEALAEVQGGLQMLAELGAFEAELVPQIAARVRVYPRAEAAAALGEARVVFEAVPEVRAAKKDAFELHDEFAPQGAILASTTSTMLSTDLQGLTARPYAFLNAHWLNPAPLVPLVELSPCETTSQEVLADMTAFLEALGKVPVTCKASPGYIVPRIQALAMNEAARLVEEGVASAEDVDRAVKYGFGLRFSVLGLLEFIDWGGGDILYHASNYMAEATGEARFAPPKIVSDNMAQGRIGLKTGAGFFDYRDSDVDAYRRDRMRAFVAAVRQAGLLTRPVAQDLQEGAENGG